MESKSTDKRISLINVQLEINRINDMMLDQPDDPFDFYEKMQARLDELDYTKEQKVDAYKMVTHSLKAEALKWKEIKDQYAKVQKAYDTQAKSMKERMKYAIEMSDSFEAVGVEWIYYITTEPLRDVVIEDRELIPDQYKLVRYDIDSEAVKNALKAGRAVPGAYLKDRMTMRSKAKKLKIAGGKK